MWVVTHPLKVVSGDDLEAALLSVEPHYRHLQATGDLRERHPEIRAITLRMRRTLRNAIDDRPVDRCELDELNEAAVEFGSWRRARQGADSYGEQREHWLDLTARMIAGTTDADDEPIDPDEIFALLAERDELRDNYGHLMPQRIRATGFAAETLMRNWIHGLPAVLTNDILAIEADYRANHRWWIRTYGKDPLAGARAQHLALFRRMRRQIERTTSLAGGRNFPQVARKTALSVDKVVHSQAVKPRLGSQPVTVVTRQKTVGTRLRAKREASGLSMNQLARAASIDVRQIYRWEHDEHTPTAASLHRLIPHIGGSVDHYLFGA